MHIQLILITFSLALITACSDDSSGSGVSEVDAASQADAAAASDAAPDTAITNADTDPNDALLADDAAPDSPEGWSTVAAMPAPRQETSVVALADEVWVLGGFTDGGAIVPTVEVYTPTTNQWRQAADLPVPMHHSNVAVWDGKIYVVGFLVGFQFIADGRAYVYDPGADAWSEIAAMPAGTERGGSGVAAIDGKIYVAGGLRRLATTEFSAYDTRTDTWEALPDLPSPRDHMAAANIDGMFLMVGGRNRAIESHTTRVDVYDPVSRTWSPRAAMPSSRGGVAAAALNGLFYVFGGEGNPDDPTGVFADAEVYDFGLDQWSVLPPMPVPRHGNGAAAVGETIYIPGGADVQAFGAVDTHEAYTP